ncbi:MAG: GFA family protein [Gammaproteobacteria bacterium]|nr:GFA family protein [Gammaproteobacteria bacterium]
MQSRSAQCSCGQLRAEVQGEPVRISVCHCKACQRRTGSTYGAQARFPRAQVSLTGRSNEYLRTAESGYRIRFHFCPDCGATVHYSLEQFPEVIAIPVGAFADPAFPAPRFSVFEAHRHPWVSTPVDVEHHD